MTTVLPTIWTCTTCSTECPPGAAFCQGCGAAREAPTTFCTNCGAQTEASAMYCASCGHPAASSAATLSHASKQAGANGAPPVGQTAVLTPIPPAYAFPAPGQMQSPPGAPSARKRSLPLIVAAVAAVVIAIAGVAFVILNATGGSSSTTTGGPTPTAGGTSNKGIAAQVSATLIPVAASQNAADASLRAVSASDGSLQQLHVSAVRLSTAVGAARARVLAMIASSDDQATLVAARKALGLQNAYATALVGLPTAIADLRAGPVSHTADIATTARVAYQDLSSTVPSAAHMNIGPAFEQRLVTIATTQQDTRAKNALLGSYLRGMDSILAASASGRGNVSTIVTQVQNGDISLQDGSAQMSGPISNRQQVLANLAALPPAPPAAASLASLLTTAIDSSLAADQAYRDWMTNLPYDYNFSVYGDPNNDDFKRAQSHSGAASSAKANFVEVYNRLARQLGLRTWSGSQI